jgi:drug/metabolite transporter (DMT)-like permease
VNQIAAVLALLATVAFAFAATLWQLASMRLGAISLRSASSIARLLTSWVWMLGLSAQILGVVLQAAALDRGRVAIIQPLLVTTVIWALPLGYFFTGQRVTWSAVGGAGTIVVGLAIFASFGDPAGGNDNAPTSDWIAAILVLAAVCVALLMFASRGGATARAAVFGAIAGVLYGLSATLMKPVVENLHTEGLHVLEDWEFWVWAATGIGGFVVQQISLATGKLVPSVATVSVANPVVSVMLGALVLQERLDKTPPWHAVLAIGGLALAMLGAVVISAGHEEPPETEKATRRPSPA